MSTSPLPSLMGRIAVSAKLITQEQLLEALHAQDHMGATKRLGDILLELGYVSQAQLEWLLRAQATLIERQHQAEAEAQRQAKVEQQKSFAQSGAIAIPPGDPAPRPVPAAPPASPPVPVQSQAPAPTGERMLDRVLTKAMQVHASDVHIHSGLPIQMRVGGRLLKANSAPLEAAQSESLILEILTESERAHFTAHNDLDFAYTIAGVGRYRGNVYRQRRGVDAVYRPIPLEPPTLDDLGLPSSLAK